MSASEQDLEQLEAYLDDALSQREADTLRLRMCQEPGLGATLEELRVERAQRSRVFKAMEGSDRACEVIMCRMQSSIRRMEIQTRHRRYMRLVGSAAACFVVGFGVAIMAGGRFPSPGTPLAGAPGGPTIGVQTVGNELPGAVHDNFGVANSPTGINETGYGPYQVTVRDGNQNPIMVRRFSTVEEARQFIEQLQKNGATQASDAPVGERF